MGRRVSGVVIGLGLATAAWAGETAPPEVPRGGPVASATGEDLVQRLADGRAFATIDGDRTPGFDDTVCRRLATVADLTSITLARVPVSAACLEALADLPRLAGLTLRAAPIDAAGVAALGRLGRLTDLTIEADGGAAPGLAEAFAPSSGLLRVRLSTRVDGETARRLGRLARLTELEIAGTTAEDGHAGLVGAPELERLATEVESNADLAALAGMARLRALEVAVGSEVDGRGVTGLAKSTTLEEVSYSAEGATTGIGALAAMPRLRTLRLVYQTVPDADLARLARAPGLVALDLREASVGDAGLATLAESRSLKHLNLWRVAVSPKVLRRLAKRMTVDTDD